MVSSVLLTITRALLLRQMDNMALKVIAVSSLIIIIIIIIIIYY